MISQVSFSGNIIIDGNERPISKIEVKGANILCLGDKTKVNPDELKVGDIFFRITKGEKANSADEIEQCLVMEKLKGGSLSYIELKDSYLHGTNTSFLKDDRCYKNGCINVYA